MHEADPELELGDYVSLIRRRWRWIAFTVLIIVGVVAAITVTRDETYESRARIEILTANNQGVFNTREAQLFRVASAEVSFMSTDSFARAVDDAAGNEVDFSVEPVVLTSGEEIQDAALLLVTARGGSAAEARNGADVVVDVYLSERVQRDIVSAEKEREALVATRDGLVAERLAAYEVISAAAAEVNQAVDPVARAEAQLRLDAATRENNAIIQDLSSRIGAINVRIGQSDTRLGILADENSVARRVSSAVLPKEPVSPDVPRNILVAVVVSLVLGVILAILRDLLDPKAHDGAGLARLVDIPVMATIGEIRSQRGAPGRVRRFQDLSAEESSGYQVLLNSLWLTNVGDPLQSIVFTSDRPSVGKTQTVVNLAQAEAARGTRVLVIDSDFVNPGVASRLGLGQSELGLVDLLDGGAAIEHVARASEIDNVHIIDAHGIVDTHGPAGSGELLRSDRFAAILAELYSRYDLILIDSPPTLSTSDSRLIASQADAVVVVYDPAVSRREELQRTIDLLRSARANLIGLVANRSRASHPVYLSARER
ncbi:MAG: AAA family ATPase [Acidimicrobiales bacterium]